MPGMGAIWGISVDSSNTEARQMARRSIPTDVQERILLQSRRRCCICFGLNRDALLKQGQIAHLDRDASNNAEDNLTFLCLAHHDMYDSPTSQSKNFTSKEVKSYRDELISFLNEELSRQISLTYEQGTADPIDGTYIRTGTIDSAELRILRLASRRFTYHVSGFAVWGDTSGWGQNTGELEFSGDLSNGRIVYIADVPWRAAEPPARRQHRITLVFRGDRLLVMEENGLGMHGMNVTFEGEYRKVSYVSPLLARKSLNRRLGLLDC